LIQKEMAEQSPSLLLLLEKSLTSSQLVKQVMTFIPFASIHRIATLQLDARMVPFGYTMY